MDKYLLYKNDYNLETRTMSINVKPIKLYIIAYRVNSIIYMYAHNLFICQLVLLFFLSSGAWVTEDIEAKYTDQSEADRKL